MLLCDLIGHRSMNIWRVSVVGVFGRPFCVGVILALHFALVVFAECIVAAEFNLSGEVGEFESHRASRAHVSVLGLATQHRSTSGTVTVATFRCYQFFEFKLYENFFKMSDWSKNDFENLNFPRIGYFY